MLAVACVSHQPVHSTQRGKTRLHSTGTSTRAREGSSEVLAVVQLLLEVSIFCYEGRMGRIPIKGERSKVSTTGRLYSASEGVEKGKKCNARPFQGRLTQLSRKRCIVSSFNYVLFI
jgi:hypothetical protein